jgi:carbon storage regulator
MLILSRKVDERIMIGDKIELSIVEIRGDQVKVGIDAPKEVKVYRQEVYVAIQKENLAAAQSNVDLPLLDRMIANQPSPNAGDINRDRGADERDPAGSSGNQPEKK